MIDVISVITEVGCPIDHKQCNMWCNLCNNWSGLSYWSQLLATCDVIYVINEVAFPTDHNYWATWDAIYVITEVRVLVITTYVKINALVVQEM